MVIRVDSLEHRFLVFSVAVVVVENIDFLDGLDNLLEQPVSRTPEMKLR
jgi:hypothetical protein